MSWPTLNDVERGAAPPETLLGVDGCRPGVSTPGQTIVHLSGAATTGNATFKLYPASHEAKSLVG